MNLGGRMLRLLLALVASCIAALCGGGGAAAQPPQLTQAPASTPIRISVGVLRLSSSGPVFIADARGYFREQGLEVALTFFTAAQQVPVAVTSGDAEFGVTGLTAGFFNLAGRGALRIIASQSREEPGFPLVAYMATNQAYEGGLRSLRDLAGRRIGITTVGSTFHYSLGLLARKYDFDLARVTMVPLQQLPNMAAAFKGGQVDAILAPATLARQLEAEHAGRVLGWVGDETPWQLGALFTSPRMIEQRREVVQRFVRAYLRGCADYNRAFNQRNAAGQVVQGEGYADALAILARVLQQPPALVADGLPFVDAGGRLNVQDIYDQVSFWQTNGQASRDVDARAIVDLSFVDGHFNVPR
jgi:NitT/TauT family transport system substrate-binding protein